MSQVQPSLRVSVSRVEHEQVGSTSSYPRGSIVAQILTDSIEYPRINVGITATRKGLTDAQKQELRKILKGAKKRYDSPWLYHGDCIGGDAQAHVLARSLSYKIRVFPPSNPKHRAYLVGDVVERPQLYSIRNHDIVRECDFLIVLPQTPNELIRSGTWSTKRYAQQRKKPYIIIYPDGTLETGAGFQW